MKSAMLLGTDTYPMARRCFTKVSSSFLRETIELLESKTSVIVVAKKKGRPAALKDTGVINKSGSLTLKFE